MAGDSDSSTLRWEPHGYEGLQARGARGTWMIFVKDARHTVWFQPNLARGMLCLKNFTNSKSAQDYCAAQEKRAC